MKLLLLAGFLVLHCCQASSAQPAKGKEVAGAKAAVQRMNQARTTAQKADCLTNESAAMVGTMIAMPLMMEYSVAAAPESVRQKAQMAQFEALIKRYGLDKAQNKGPESKEWKGFAVQGRRFLVEMDQFMTRTGRGGQWTLNRRASSPEALRYTVLGPRRVAIRDPRRPKDPPMEARLEDGKWRLHLSLDGR